MRRFLLSVLFSGFALSVYCKKDPIHSDFCIVGSVELQVLLDAWTHAYSVKNRAPLHEGRGNELATVALADGLCEMVALTRPMNREEISRITEISGMAPLAIPIAVETFVMISGRDHPAEHITAEEIRSLYADPETVKGPLSGSVPHTLPFSSDRGRWFQRTVLNGAPVSEHAIEVAGPLALADAIASSPKGIGYIHLAEMRPGLKILKVAQGDGSGYLSRYHYIYIRGGGKPSGESAEFLRFILSEGGQRLLEPLGLQPVGTAVRRESVEWLQ